MQPTPELPIRVAFVGRMLDDGPYAAPGACHPPAQALRRTPCASETTGSAQGRSAAQRLGSGEPDCPVSGASDIGFMGDSRDKCGVRSRLHRSLEIRNHVPPQTPVIKLTQATSRATRNNWHMFLDIKIKDRCHFGVMFFEFNEFLNVIKINLSTALRIGLDFLMLE